MEEIRSIAETWEERLSKMIVEFSEKRKQWKESDEQWRKRWKELDEQWKAQADSTGDDSDDDCNCDDNAVVESDPERADARFTSELENQQPSPQPQADSRSTVEIGNNNTFFKFLSSTPKLELECPKFDGTNPRNWIQKCGRYMELLKHPDYQRVDIASLYMVGKADEWMRGYLSIRRGVCWNEFVMDLLGKFGDEGVDVCETNGKLEVASESAMKPDIEENSVSGDNILSSVVVSEVANDVLKVAIEPGKGRNPQLETEKVPTTIAPELFDGSPKKGKSACDIEESVRINVVDGQVKPLPWRDKNDRYDKIDRGVTAAVVLDVVSHLVGTGEEIVDRYDLYGDRLLSQVIPKIGAVVNYLSTKLDKAASAIGPWIKLGWLELHNIDATNVKELFVFIFDPGGTFDVSCLTICNAAMGKPDSHIANLDEVIKSVEDQCLKSYKSLDLSFSLGKLMISNFKSKYLVSQLGLRLISDLVVVIVSATCVGIACACVVASCLLVAWCSDKLGFSNLHLVGEKQYLLILGTMALRLVTTLLFFKLIPAVMHLGILWFDSAKGAVAYCGDVTSRISLLISTRGGKYLWMLVAFVQCASMITGEYFMKERDVQTWGQV